MHLQGAGDRGHGHVAGAGDVDVAAGPCTSPTAMSPEPATRTLAAPAEPVRVSPEPAWLIRMRAFDVGRRSSRRSRRCRASGWPSGRPSPRPRRRRRCPRRAACGSRSAACRVQATSPTPRTRTRTFSPRAAAVADAVAAGRRRRWCGRRRCAPPAAGAGLAEMTSTLMSVRFSGITVTRATASLTSTEAAWAAPAAGRRRRGRGRRASGQCASGTPCLRLYAGAASQALADRHVADAGNRLGHLAGDCLHADAADAGDRGVEALGLRRRSRRSPTPETEAWTAPAWPSATLTCPTPGDVAPASGRSGSSMLTPPAPGERGVEALAHLGGVDARRRRRAAGSRRAGRAHPHRARAGFVQAGVAGDVGDGPGAAAGVVAGRGWPSGRPTPIDRAAGLDHRPPWACGSPPAGMSS